MIFKKYIVFLVFVLSNSQSAEIETQGNKNAPTIYLSKDEVNDLGKMKVRDLLFLMEHNIPISPQSKQYKNILKKVKRNKQNKIIQSEDRIIVELYGLDNKTNERIKVMDVIYLFKDKKLIKGPVVKRNSAVRLN